MTTRWPARSRAAACFSQGWPSSGWPWIGTTGCPVPWSSWESSMPVVFSWPTVMNGMVSAAFRSGAWRGEVGRWQRTGSRWPVGRSPDVIEPVAGNRG
ncbi:hypothetical protein ADK41_07255 [Streptomyces caelestis]|uniref:Uncharacterized protein n=1 Tax=Streptomyces caelestis TaxID=36816 RepID=A0A0M8QL15_9ACTN|nr:hypothetical protein ADK41_07255 [Streptomyces caelestis]KOV29969.1 hypothetical protein ADK58_08830 [Streptomyces sp. XY152]